MVGVAGVGEERMRERWTSFNFNKCLKTKIKCELSREHHAQNGLQNVSVAENQDL